MASQSERGPGDQATPPQMAQTWEASQRALMDGWRQGQEFWANAARSWGEVATSWMTQLSRPGVGASTEAMGIVRELQEAAFAAGMAWMRLPLVLASGARPVEFQEVVMRLTQAQGRAYQLWAEALTRATTAATSGRTPA
jgi:hypothetical protein